ncbi:hypothetical protein L6164_009649 [Bauhinia variegata]|uniref:Uncharacterized protein n=1 Tax=Bauhinia variegata TaxID=167791 RepID=A0ACB9PJF5_BAUVA|nr:hypothetical protein L6164_009649 [Bauhinia variegata]
MSTRVKMLGNVLQLLVFCLYSLPILIRGSNQHQREAYIVYMGELPKARAYITDVHHHDLLTFAIGDERLARQSRIHSYGKSFNGFVARLLPHEADKLREDENVLSVFKNTKRKLHTTRSWDFLRMPLKVKRHSNIESHIIVGLLDTGISMDCPSFNDKGYGPPPRRWKGKCLKGGNFTGCNNKVIGAKYYQLDDMDPFFENPSPADEQGHGTHTASTLAGVPVEGASVFGIGEGTARGGVPSARISIYKVCWTAGCNDMDLLAAFDDAILDGVNFLSVSIGGPPREFFSDSIAIGSFHAMKRGILTSCSAGNDGPYIMSVENVAPWILTVAASGIDRQFTTVVGLGNGKNATGLSVNTFAPKKKMYPLISGDRAANATGDIFGNYSACDYGTLDRTKVKGRIAYCLGYLSGHDSVIKDLGGTGVIMGVGEKTDISYVTLIAGTLVDGYTVGKTINDYINSTKNPRAVIYKTEGVKIPAPFLASFSSRGPQVLTRNILKPDLAAPGLDILAGFSKSVSLTGYPEDTRYSVFNIISGTSMACPHATAAAAYVKSFHPDWSPAAIKSALMTTATPMVIKEEDAELGYGSGQINPTGALHPGLVYDIKFDLYVAFLCKQGFNSSDIGILVGIKRFNCSSIKTPPGADGLNYPTMYYYLREENSRISAVFHRRARNVGYGNSTYKARLTMPKGLTAEVIPNTLRFTRLHQERSFKVVVRGPPMSDGTHILSGSLEWSDSKHSVRTPIVVFRTINEP